MTTAEQQGEEEKAAAEKLLAADPKFRGVEAITVELGEDHTGDPSMWIVFHVQPQLLVDVPWIEEFSRYSTKMSSRLLRSGLTRFPYHRLEPAA